jgi:hypothetical protein
MLAISIKWGGASSNDDWKVVTPPDVMALTNSPKCRQSDGNANKEFIRKSSLFVFYLRFARIGWALHLTLDMTAESVGKDSWKRGRRRFLRTNAGAFHIATSCRIVCNCGSKRFFMYTPALFLSDISWFWLGRHPLEWLYLELSVIGIPFRGAPSMSWLAKVKLTLKAQERLLETVFLLLSGGRKSKNFSVQVEGLCFPQTIEEPWMATLNPLI